MRESGKKEDFQERSGDAAVTHVWVPGDMSSWGEGSGMRSDETNIQGVSGPES